MKQLHNDKTTITVDKEVAKKIKIAAAQLDMSMMEYMRKVVGLDRSINETSGNKNK